MRIFQDKKLTVKEIWLTSIQLYSKVFSQVWSQAAILGVVMVTLAWFGSRLIPNMLKLGAYSNLQNVTPVSGVYAFVYLVALLLSVYLNSLVLYRTYVIGSEQKATFLTSLVFVWKKFFKIVVSMLLLSCVSMLGVFVLVLPPVMAMLPAMLVGFLTVIFSMVLPLILIDDKGCFDALKDSCKLVWGNWWRTFAALVPVAFLKILTGFAAQFITTHSVWWYGSIVTVISTTLLCSLFYACVLIQYGDLKLRHHTKHNDISI